MTCWSVRRSRPWRSGDCAASMRAIIAAGEASSAAKNTGAAAIRQTPASSRFIIIPRLILSRGDGGILRTYDRRMSALSAVIFDFDGVVLDSETPEYESHRRIYE